MAMARARECKPEQHYNRGTDVLTVQLRDVSDVFTEDTPSGFIVYFAAVSGEPVAVEVLSYCRRFGSAAKILRVDAPVPFDVHVCHVECDPQVSAVDTSAFQDLLRTVRRDRATRSKPLKSMHA